MGGDILSILTYSVHTFRKKESLHADPKESDYHDDKEGTLEQPKDDSTTVKSKSSSVGNDGINDTAAITDDSL